jgi:glycerophosphoryl diester phosphodiesterase
LHYLIGVLSLVFVIFGGVLLIVAQVSEFGLKQRQLNDWVYQTPIAHRGFYDNVLIPENSLAAFNAAVAKGYAIELDVHLSKDGEVIVFHDEDFKRATGQHGRVTETAYPQFQGYFLWHTQEKIPTLKQTLELVHGQVPVLIEIKNAGEAGLLEEKVNQLITNYSGPLIIVSFNPKSLEWFRVHAPDILRGQNLFLEQWHAQSWIQMIHQTFQHCRLSKPHVIIYNAIKVPTNVVQALSWFKPFIAYNVTSHDIAASIKNIASNIIFDHFEPNSKPIKQS